MTGYPSRTLQRPCQTFALIKILLNQLFKSERWHVMAGILPECGFLGRAFCPTAQSLPGAAAG
jgi:hypothetical protein